MNVIGWNCRVLGRPQAVRALRDLISSHSPSIVGLSETKSTSKQWDTLRVKMGFQNCFSVNCTCTRSGGLALLWKSDIDIEICSYSKFHVDAFVKSPNSFRFTLFYGHPRVDKRKESWDLLRLLAQNWVGPWMVLEISMKFYLLRKYKAVECEISIR